MKKFLGFVLILAACHSTVLAQRQLSSAEINTILQGLTAQPRNTWITSGALTAEHTAYKPAQITDEAQLQQLIADEIADYQNSTHKPEVDTTLQKMRLEAIPFNVRYEYANEYTMKTTETVHYNDGRFRWSQELLAREDSVRPPLDKTFMYEYFDPQTQAAKTIAWNGETFTRYDESMEFVEVAKAQATAPNINGPLTAGVVPWGYGAYSWQRLSEATITATETNSDGAIEVDMQIHYPTGFFLELTLDGDKAWTVSDYILTFPGGDMILQTYDDFVLIGSTWMPQTVTIEKLHGDLTLISRDIWSYTNISLATPAQDVFTVKPAQGASIDLSLSPTAAPLRYYASYSDQSLRQVDSETLLAKRLAAQNLTGPANCATAALAYVGEKLGRNWSASQLAPLVDSVNGSTSMYTMREYCRQQGLYAAAVKADLKSLMAMAGTQVILHLPHKNHFVVLAEVDDIYVHLIDLTSDRFYYRVERSQFHLDWPDGAALMVSNSPLSTPVEIPYEELTALKGAAGYSCTRVIQERWVDFCDGGSGELCMGYCTLYYDVFGCQTAESGSCTYKMVVRKMKTPCFNDPYDFLVCIYYEDYWTTYYTYGCEIPY